MILIFLLQVKKKCKIHFFSTVFGIIPLGITNKKIENKNHDIKEYNSIGINKPHTNGKKISRFNRPNNINIYGL